MPQQLPPSWPAPSANETLPVVYLSVGDDALGTRAVASWKLERELVGSTLPGNVRGRSGLSIGTASVTLAQTSERVSPWRAAPARVRTGAPAQLYASHDGPEATERLDLGDWMLDPLSGSIGTNALGVDLVEAQYGARGKPHQLPVARYGAKPVWIVDQLARQCGYYSTPESTAPVLVESFAGGVCDLYAASFADTDRTIANATWTTATGVLGLTAASDGTWASLLRFDSEVDLVRQALLLSLDSNGGYVSLNHAGTVRLIIGSIGMGEIPPSGVEVEVRPGGVLAARVASNLAWVTGSYTAGQDVAWPNRVQLQIVRDQPTETTHRIQVRARSSEASPWSAWVEASGDYEDGTTPRAGYLGIWMDTGASISGLVASRGSAGHFTPPTALLEDLGGFMRAPWVPEQGADAWAGIQLVAEKWLGAASLTADRRFVLRNRDDLAGVDATEKVIDVGAQVEDLGWTIDPADTADRLVVTYSPVDDVKYYGDAPIDAWESADALEIGPGETLEVTADLDQFTEPAEFEQAPSVGDGYLSQWLVSTTRNGSGVLNNPDALTVTVVPLNPGRVLLRVKNRLSSRLWTVNSQGEPHFKLRGFAVLSQKSAAMIARGLPAEEADNALSIDLGKFVQRAADAEQIADYLWSRVSTPTWKASSVRVRLDWSVDIGDVVRLVHARSDLSVRALVVKVALDGEPGKVAQVLDLVLVPQTWDDFDAAWAGATWADFDAAWAGATWDDFDFDPTSTTGVL